jgi:hypothetical protein
MNDREASEHTIRALACRRHDGVAVGGRKSAFVGVVYCVHLARWLRRLLQRRQQSTPENPMPTKSSIDAQRNDSAQFWKQAHAHEAWKLSLPDEQKAEVDDREAALDSITRRLR